MRNYFQVRLGKANVYAAECLANGYVGTSCGRGCDPVLVLEVLLG